MSLSCARRSIFVGLIVIALFLGVGSPSCLACVATGDCDNNGIVLSVSDLVYLLNWIHGDGPAPVNLCDSDLNGDCYVDEADAELYACIFENGLMACLPHYPLTTCDNPDTVRGACCDDLGNCVVRSLANCEDLHGIYHGDGTVCNDALCRECGDVNASGGVDISDAVYLVLYIFSGGSAPLDVHGGDVNCDGTCDISDPVYLLQYIFSSGSAPCAGC